MLSYWSTVGGYVLAAVGSLLLFLGTPHDVGMGRIPRVPGAQATEFFQSQDRSIRRRQNQTRIGFALLLIGMVLQLVGFLIGAARFA